ncbi:hypothetical protein D9619_010480 [Psilocybe cf. subviscida]|uniref:O-methyltransferase domain-containing protein n=1 Tax=Psilocybe cf. subviscida TaxID=2480587 RepID=A0A8H5ASS6_9AGAR|nr:hypothetical protein D9619_010480 [Psilocybe cf. subviscida]
MAPYSPPNGLADLIALSQLISTAVGDIVQEYNTLGQALPPLSSVQPGPLDEGPHLVPPRLAKAVTTIEAACAQLSFAVANPGHVMINKAYGHMEPAALLAVTDAKIADMLVGKPAGVHVGELSKQSGLDAGKLGRILRALATKHCFQEVGPDMFANNRLSMQLVSTNPVSSFIGHLTDETMKASAYLYDTISDPVSAVSVSPNAAPFKRAHGKALFDFYHSPEHKKENDRFAQGMVGLGNVTGKQMLPKVYNWDEVPADSTVCDVGSGNGHVTMALVKEFPKIRLVLQDKAVVMEQGREPFNLFELWSKEYPEAVTNERVQFTPLDFLSEPPVAGCDFYYIRYVLHDWPVEQCCTILNNVRQSMKPTSRLLIPGTITADEFVLQQAFRSDEGVIEQAPEPLLANYGVGRARLYQQDLNMMILLNSKERTLQEFVQLGESCGFKFVKLWDAGEAGLLEFCLA